MKTIGKLRAAEILRLIKLNEKHENIPFIRELDSLDPRPKSDVHREECVDWLNSLLETDYDEVDRNDIRKFLNWMKQIPLEGMTYLEKRRMDNHRNVAKYRAG